MNRSFERETSTDQGDIQRALAPSYHVIGLYTRTLTVFGRLEQITIHFRVVITQSYIKKVLPSAKNKLMIDIAFKNMNKVK